jgi:Fur family ferric uptake transcriptional regulator
MDASENILTAKNIRITPARQLLLDHFLAHQQTHGLQDLEKAFPRTDRITMYRTLKTFEENGIIHRIDNGTAEVKYALCKEHCTPTQHLDQHPHFHCQQCKNMVCLEEVVLPTLHLPKGYVAHEMQMTIKGICRNCQP